MELKDLKPNPKNPRKITDKKLQALKKALEQFGDLSGIVVNRRTGQLVGGHQRKKIFETCGGEIHVEAFEEPTSAGTIAEGYVLIDGEKFSYREVDWDEAKETAANIAANKGAGDWDFPKLTEMLLELDHMNFDMGLTMFDDKEVEKFFGQKPDEWGEKPPEGDAPASSVGEGTQVTPASEGSISRILLLYNEAEFKDLYPMAELALEKLSCHNMSELFKTLLEQYFEKAES